MSLRLKLILGFLVPAVMLITAGFWSSYQMRKVGDEVAKMLEENDRSIIYAVQMMESLERLDSGVLLKLQGDHESFRRISERAITEFKEAQDSAYANITLKNERETLDSLKRHSQEFFKMIEALEAGADIEAYRSEMFPLFEKTQHFISDLRLLNSEAMYRAAQDVIDGANRAALPGDMIVACSLIFLLLFGWLTQLYIVQPLRNILDSVKEWQKTGEYKAPRIASDDEIKKLSDLLETLPKEMKAGK